MVEVGQTFVSLIGIKALPSASFQAQFGFVDSLANINLARKVGPQFARVSLLGADGEKDPLMQGEDELSGGGRKEGGRGSVVGRCRRRRQLASGQPSSLPPSLPAKHRPLTESAERLISKHISWDSHHLGCNSNQLA